MLSGENLALLQKSLMDEEDFFKPNREKTSMNGDSAMGLTSPEKMIQQE